MFVKWNLSVFLVPQYTDSMSATEMLNENVIMLIWGNSENSHC